jgi:hypothetical protein
MKKISVSAVLFFIVSIFLMNNVFAHAGRSYLIFQRKNMAAPVADILSVRVDPDKEKGTFEFFIEGHPAANDYKIELSATPANDPAHVLTATATLEKNESTSDRQVYQAILPFDKALSWNVDLVLKQKGNIVFNSRELVEVVEPGPNQNEFLLFTIPFLLVGFLLAKVISEKRKNHKRTLG